MAALSGPALWGRSLAVATQGEIARGGRQGLRRDGRDVRGADSAGAGTRGPSVLAAWEVWVTLEGGVARPEPNTEAQVADKKPQTEAAQQGSGGAGQTQGGQKPNKMEAMRQVLAKLGDDAPTPQIRSELKETFGIDMTTKNIATYRADILKKR